MTVGIAADHGGFELKIQISTFLHAMGYEVKDFGATTFNKEDDYPDFVIPLSLAVKERQVDKGIAICGSGVGAAIVANKIHGVRAALINDIFSARQGVEDDDMNLLCLGGRIIGASLALELIKAFIKAEFTNLERHKRRLAKVIALEQNHK